MGDNQSLDILQIQKSLFASQNPQIITNIEGNILIASNINEIDIINVTLVANGPQYNTIMTFVDCSVYLNKDFIASPVAGLDDILSLQITVQNSEAYKRGDRTYKAWDKGFRCGPFNKLVDDLTGLTKISPDSKGIPRTYTLVFEAS